MTSIPDNLAPETLLAQQDFVRGLARSLLGGASGIEDVDDVDDVVQGTLARAITSPPVDSGRVRQWLASVARNLVRDRRRSSSRRRRHERRASRREALPSTDEVVQREHQRRRVVEAVLRLADPYRTAVLARYWEDLPSKVMAERLGVPEATARSHVHRGLEMLRKQLDAEYGDRDRWMAALIPCAAVSRTASPAAGAILMSTKPKIVLVACGILIAGLATFAALEFSGGEPTPEDGSGPFATRTGDLSSPAESSSRAVQQPDGGDPNRTSLVTPDGELVVTGLVTDEDRPFANLEVTLQWFRGYEPEGKPAAEHRVRTDAGGEFRWTGPQTEVVSSVRAVTSNPRVKLLGTPVIVMPEDVNARLDVQGIPLDCELFGVIRNVAGEGIKGARICIKGWEEAAVDEQGNYSMLVGRGPHSRTLVIWGPDYTPRFESTHIPVTSDRYRLDFVLQPGARIAGRIVNEAGEPIEGADVAASLPYYHVKTDSHGRFELASLGSASDHHVEVRAAGYLNAGKTFPVGTEDAELVLKRGLEFNGRVVDAQGRGVAGALVEAAWERHGSRRGYSRSDGSFLIAACGDGKSYVKVTKAGYVNKRVVAMVSADREDLRIEIERGRSARGLVTDLAGTPIAGAAVYRVVGKMNSAPDDKRAITDSKGRFELRELSGRGKFNLGARKNGYLFGVAEDVTTDTSEIRIRLGRGASIAGRVLDEVTRQPIQQFSLSVSTDEGLAGRGAAIKINGTDGYWDSRWKSYPPGRGLFARIEAEGYAAQQVSVEATVDPPRDQVIILMRKAKTLNGTVRDVVSGAPIAGATIKLLDAADEDYWRIAFPSVPSATSDASGEFVMKSVSAGSIKLVVIHPDYTNRIHGPIEIEPGPGTKRVRIPMDHGVKVGGRIEGFDGVNLRVQIMSYRGLDDHQTIELGAARKFEFEGLGEGRHVVAIHGPGRSFLRSENLVIASANIDSVVLREIEGPCSVTVTVKGLDAGEARLRPKKGTKGSSRMFEFEQGRFTQTGLSVGTHRIRVESDGRRVEKEAELVEGENEVVVEFGR